MRFVLKPLILGMEAVFFYGYHLAGKWDGTVSYSKPNVLLLVRIHLFLFLFFCLPPHRLLKAFVNLQSSKQVDVDTLCQFFVPFIEEGNFLFLHFC